MKGNSNAPENLWDSNTLKNASPSKFIFFFILFISFPYLLYSLNFAYSSYSCNRQFPPIHLHSHASVPSQSQNPKPPEKTVLRHIVFGIAASAKIWDRRKNYIKQWWRQNETRGVVWLDKPVKNLTGDQHLLPPLKISGDISGFKYENREGYRSAIRISRIVSETLNLVMENVRWFVMGDDDTFFVPENLVRVLEKYDHNQYYYIGGVSETHLQNIVFSYNMAYGGGGFAISFPLAKALAKMQDKCIQRYPALYGSDDRIQACMAELGVPLTREQGFHQFDLHGNVFGLLAAHPITPLVSLHHLDLVEPIFPKSNRVQSLQRLNLAIKLDSAAVMQQSICYDKTRSWTVSVSWGYAVQIFGSVLSAREIELPARTFINWHNSDKSADFASYAFNTRPFSKDACQEPFVYYLSNAVYNASANETASEYVQHRVPNPECKRSVADPFWIDRVEVYKRRDPMLWSKFDLHGNVFGLLAAHPITPLVSLHHLDLVEPIFPKSNRVQSLQRLNLAIKLDSAAVMQQSICYDKTRSWTVSVSWGYAVQIFGSVLSAREIELPARTFINWHNSDKSADFASYAFNTRPFSNDACQEPFVFYLSNAVYNASANETASEYIQHRVPNPECKRSVADPFWIDRVEVYKRRDPMLWSKSRRRNCCRILPTKKKGTMVINVGGCEEDEIVELS